MRRNVGRNGMSVGGEETNWLEGVGIHFLDERGTRRG
jgi:hypothetical protein